MVIEDKYFGLIHTLIYDKRLKMCGMISELTIMKNIDGYGIAYTAFMNPLYSKTYIFVEDFEKGNVVFLMPYDVRYYMEEADKFKEIQKKAIKDFFGDSFREDMIMEISEEERQNEIREWEKRLRGLDNWAYKFCELEKQEY